MTIIPPKTKRKFEGSKGEIIHHDTKVGGFSGIDVVEIMEVRDDIIREWIDVQIKDPYIGSRYLDLFGWGKNNRGAVVFGGTNSKFSIATSGKLFEGSSERHSRATIKGLHFDLSEHQEEPEKWCADLDQMCKSLTQVSGRCYSFDCLD